ncbi:hypothetical protein O206_13015 [Ochrobactrum sp. EGD-AQ16]|uniref:Uncharacterized protein n=1 Tax=Brucella intermedia 229E TaxID=1337887 RepID=U4V3Y7_9HYPH|nr:hypothetical protein O206_13015 [Ochrobactrum sp. EGD-AQ16]ERM00720.1 hypothetical protein Q644_25300 [Brucella intermedia 229E]
MWFRLFSLRAILALATKKRYIGRDFPEIVVLPTSRATGADEQKDYI